MTNLLISSYPKVLEPVVPGALSSEIDGARPALCRSAKPTTADSDWARALSTKVPPGFPPSGVLSKAAPPADGPIKESSFDCTGLCCREEETESK